MNNLRNYLNQYRPGLSIKSKVDAAAPPPESKKRSRVDEESNDNAKKKKKKKLAETEENDYIPSEDDQEGGAVEDNPIWDYQIRKSKISPVVDDIARYLDKVNRNVIVATTPLNFSFEIVKKTTDSNEVVRSVSLSVSPEMALSLDHTLDTYKIFGDELPVSNVNLQFSDLIFTSYAVHVENQKQENATVEQPPSG